MLLDSHASRKVPKRWGNTTRAFKKNSIPNEIRKSSVINCSIFGEFCHIIAKSEKVSELHYSRSISLVRNTDRISPKSRSAVAVLYDSGGLLVPWITPARKNTFGRPPAF